MDGQTSAVALVKRPTPSGAKGRLPYLSCAVSLFELGCEVHTVSFLL